VVFWVDAGIVEELESKVGEYQNFRGSHTSVSLFPSCSSCVSEQSVPKNYVSLILLACTTGLFFLFSCWVSK
jgi:hypothetical protein